MNTTHDTMMSATFCELNDAGLIAVEGTDAAAFLQAQLTSDIAKMRGKLTQHSGYCNPKGRLLATFLVWRDEDRFVLQLPAELQVSIQERLSKYVLRARVAIGDATSRYRLFGTAGAQASSALAAISGQLPQAMHEVVCAPGVSIARLPVDRYLMLADASLGPQIRAALQTRAQERSSDEWARLDIEAGVPVITARTQEEFVPQMVNLDLIGGVSYSKGCYPGQEIVARMHYLGRIKQRMYRVHVPDTQNPIPGDALFSSEFGSDQSSGAIVNASSAPGGGFEALAVIQTASVAKGSVHWKAPDGPALAFLPLPYVVPV